MERYSPGSSFLLILLCSTIFSTNIIAARLSGQLYDPFLTTLYRWAFVGIALSPYVLLTKGSKIKDLPAPAWYDTALYSLFGLLLPTLLTFLAGLTTTALNLTVIYSSTPAVIYLMTAATGTERITVWPLIGLLVATLGVVGALYFGRDGVAGYAFRQGDIFAALAVLSWAFYSVHFAGKASVLQLPQRLWLASWFCTGTLFVLVLATGRFESFGDLTPGFLFLAAFVALVPSILGYLLHAHLTRAVGVARVGLMSYLVPVAAGGQAMLLLSESVSLVQLAAAGMVLLGVWISGR